MANSTSTEQLYAAISQLAYSETNIASTPRKPFELADATSLLEQSNKLAEQGDILQSRNPETLSQAAVDDAIALVIAAQEAFDIISVSPTTVIGREFIFSAVDAAIDSIAIALG